MIMRSFFAASLAALALASCTTMDTEPTSAAAADYAAALADPARPAAERARLRTAAGRTARLRASFASSPTRTRSARCDGTTTPKPKVCWPGSSTSS